MVGAPFHPQSNGEVESAVTIIKNCIRKANVRASGANLSRHVNNFLFQYRNTLHSTTGESPAKLLINRGLRCVVDLLKPNTENIVESKQFKQVAKFKGRRMVSFNEGENVMFKTTEQIMVSGNLQLFLKNVVLNLLLFKLLMG